MKRSKTYRPKNNKTAGDYLTERMTDYMTYDGTKEDYYDDSLMLGVLDSFSGGFFGSLRQSKEQAQRLEDTMEMFGLRWSDIKYPALTASFGATRSMSNSGLNFVSDNVRRLYR